MRYETVLLPALDGGRAPFGLTLESHPEAQATFDVLRHAVECDPKSRYSANTKCSNNSTCNLLMEESMDKLSRRSMLRRSYGVAGAAATSLPAGNSQTRAKRPEPDRKLRVVAVGGHFDDPQTCAGGTLTLFADQGHDVVALSITGGPPPTPDRNPEEREVKFIERRLWPLGLQVRVRGDGGAL